MKQIEISLQGICDAFKWVGIAAWAGLMAYIAGYALIYEANWNWSLAWQIPAWVAGFVGALFVIGGFMWVYDKNPTLKLGKKEPKPEFPKAWAKRTK